MCLQGGRVNSVNNVCLLGGVGSVNRGCLQGGRAKSVNRVCLQCG